MAEQCGQQCSDKKVQNKSCVPPCAAPCNPDATPPAPGETDAARLTLQLRQTEEDFKVKITECAILRAELVERKNELEKERQRHAEVRGHLRELEMKFEGLTTQTQAALATKEQDMDRDSHARALQATHTDAVREMNDMKLLIKDQNDQLQEYRAKYILAQQRVEEQARQLDVMELDNTRISEQINLEIQRVKLKFQEKLQELAPIPQLLQGTEARLREAQQAQAVAEHKAEQLARELYCAREKVHVLMHNASKPTEKSDSKGEDLKQVAMLQQKVSQLTEINNTLKAEVERLKSNVMRAEEQSLANEKRLHEKMHECAALGGELDRARQQTAQELQRANERTNSVRGCLQTTIAELERQLAAARARVCVAEKDRNETQCRLQSQVQRLSESLDQAQERILGMQEQLKTLKKNDSRSGMDGQQKCDCKSFFGNP